MVKNPSVTHLSQEDTNSFFRSFPKIVFWSIVLLFVMGFIAAVFILAAVGNPILLVVVVVLFAIVSSAFSWNAYWGRKAVIKYISEYPDAQLRTAKDGQFVKVSGVSQTDPHIFMHAHIRSILLLFVICTFEVLDGAYDIPHLFRFLMCFSILY